MVLENLLGRKTAPNLPRPLTDYLLDVDGVADVGLRLELKLRVTEEEEVRIRGPGIRSFIPGTVPRRVEKVEKLNAYYLESEWSDKIYIFCTREAAADYLYARREGKAELERARAALAAEKAEARLKAKEAAAEVERLEVAIANATDRFLDSEGNLGFTKAQGDLVAAERRLKDLKLKLRKPEPQPDMGSAIATMFGCDEIITRGEIVEAVRVERAALLKRFRGLPDESTLRLGRHAILLVTWKRP